MLPAPETTRPLSTLRGRLVDRGYQEVITFSFVSSEREQRLGLDASPIRVLNPIASQFDVMRPSLLGGLLETLRTNLNRKASRVRIFETGRCFLRAGERFEQPLRLAALAYGPAAPEQWAHDRREVDFFDLKGDVEALVSPTALSTEAARHPALHPGRSARVLRPGGAIGWLGELHPRLVQMFELPAAPMVAELDLAPLLETVLPRALAAARVPIVRRDLALVVDETLPAQQVLDALRQAAPPYVVQLKLFDVYRGPNVGPSRKSLAILVLMQDTERTLTDPEIDAAIAVLLRQAEKRFGGTLRQ
jgi:phenylalanyl-tRNA synthetase beta chain